MADSGKRKATRDAEGGALKKKKKGNSGKWKTPKTSSDADGGAERRPKANTIEPGDVGIWVTCPLHMKGKAAREMELLFDDYAEKMYGIKTDTATGSDADDDDEEEEDIENAIRKELGELKDKSQGGRGEPGPGSGGRSVFTEVRVSQECLLFMRCRQPPVEPVAFCRRICVDAATVGHGGQRARYLNRLTPVSVMVKASETGVEEGARRALAGHFRLKTKGEAAGVGVGAEGQSKEGEEEVVVSEEKETPATYAIRPSIRNHNTLKRDDVIKLVASLVDPQHKVNLGAPDKVILIDIYQGVCGFSVVPGDWDSLKRYNLTELYKQKASGGQGEKETGGDAVVAEGEKE